MNYPAARLAFHTTFAKCIRNTPCVRIVLGRFCLLAMALVLTACGKTETNMALGTLERDRVTLSATASEIITAQPLAQGSRVAAGDLLVQLDPTLQNAAITKLQADIAQQDANLEKLHNGARPEEIAAAAARRDTATEVLKNANTDLTRVRKLVDQKVSAQADLDTALSRRDTNAAQLREAEAQLQLLQAGSRAEDIRQVESQRDASRALLVAEQQKLANLSVVATRSGILDSLPWKVGERVSTGQQLAVVLVDALPYARIYIPETSRTAVKQGDTLTVHVDGVATPFTGTVRWIADEPAFTPYFALTSSERSHLVYLAELVLSDNAADLPVGIPVQTELP